jgi:hypothetical protein
MTSARIIAEALAGRKVKSYGRNYLVRCPCHDDQSPSLSICDGDRGLMVHCFVGCAPGDIYAAIRRKGYSLGRDNTANPIKGSSEYERRQHEKAAWLWSQRRPIAGTIAERYLRGRGITCPLPATLGFLPAHKPEHHPALIAAFAIPDELDPGVLAEPRKIDSVHLTLLAADGNGKANIEKPKIIVGGPGALPIVLAPANDLHGLAATEGIEDGLTALQATGLGTWAAGNAGRMATLAEVIPTYIECVTIFAHADRAGRPGAHGLAMALDLRGVEVLIEGLVP